MYKDFDISLADVILQYDLSEKQIEELGVMTSKRRIASYTGGGEVYYRRVTIERLYGERKQ
ncbi:hypothetical protein D3C79_516450 [compost metagenome]